MGRSTLDRRSFLAASGTVAAGLAGCATPRDRTTLARTATDQFRVSTGRHGFRAGRAPADIERAWRLPGINVGEHTAAKGSPIPLPDGDLLVTGDTGLLYRVRPDGDIRWQAATDPSVRGIHGTPAVANDTVYVGAYDGSLYAFDVETGIREWRSGLGDAIGSSPLYFDGSVVIAVEYYQPDGRLFAVDAGSGSVTWSSDRPTDHPHSSPALDPATGTLVVGSNDGTLYAWEYPSMQPAWEVPTGGPIKGPIATADGAAFVGSWDRHVYRVDLETGDVDWMFEAGDLVMAGPGIEPGTETVYVGTHDRHLYALAVETGQPRWSFETGGALIGCPAVVDDAVLVGSYDGHCYGVDRATGKERWRAPATGWVTSTPLLHEGSVYFADRATDRTPGALYRYTGV